MKIRIREQIKAIEAEQGVQVQIDEGLLNEVLNLVEYQRPLLVILILNTLKFRRSFIDFNGNSVSLLYVTLKSKTKLHFCPPMGMPNTWKCHPGNEKVLNLHVWKTENSSGVVKN